MKIPVERTIANAYGFAVSNIFSMLGISWFPYLIFAGTIGLVVYLLGPQFLVALKTLGTQPKPDPSAMLAFFTLIWRAEALILPAGLLVSAMVAVGIARKALGLRPRPNFFFFSLGMPVWRLLGARVLIAMSSAVAFVLIILVGIGVIGAFDASDRPRAVAVAVIGGIALVFAWIYVVLRVWFFLPAVIVAEDRFGLSRSWTLGRGNFWRILGIILVTTLPVAFAAQIIISTLVQSALIPTFATTPSQLNGDGNPQEMLKAMIDALAKVGPYVIVVYLVEMILVNALNTGAAAIAYRMITEENGAKAPA